MTKEEMLGKFRSYNPNQDTKLLEEAYDFAKKAHEGQKRASGDPYFDNHCMAVVEILLDHKLDMETLCAGILHDILEDTEYKVVDLEKRFGKNITHMVQGVTKISDLKFSSSDEETVENWRKMLVAIAKDVRVILVKLADRTHNMRTLQFLPDADRRKRKATETLNLYAPLAQRLGMFSLKTELEDLSFKHLCPSEFAKLYAQVEKRTKDREGALNSFREKLSKF